MAETVGSLCDKISIAELKIYHMAEQLERTDVTDEFRTECAGRLEVLRRQRDDLAEELTTLLEEITAGRHVPKVYHQFKLYNDPRYRSD